MTSGTTAAGVHEPFDATPVRVYLTEAHFSEPRPPDEAPGSWSDETEFELSISLYRQSLRTLTVALNLKSGEHAPAGFSVSYAGDWMLDEQYPQDQIDSAWQSLAFDVAPNVLYPSIREEVSRLTAHSRVGMLALPVLPLPLRRPADLQIPAPPETQVSST
jgi:preprotein translocase subunit SecB